MKLPGLTRRRFLGLAALLSPVAAAADARFVELDWVKLKRVCLSVALPSRRVVHFSDLHHKGDVPLLTRVVEMINALAPEFVCFTGDIVEEQRYVAEALDLLSHIKAPMYGVPGNHDYWSKVDFAPIRELFASTGGAWLVDESATALGGKVNIIGAARLDRSHPLPVSAAGLVNVLLIHYPSWVKKLGSRNFDLILAGHSHGGQVRLPFYGALQVPFGVDEYEIGLFRTKWGPLYVNPGIGYIYDYNFRFNCRPEVTLIEL